LTSFGSNFDVLQVVQAKTDEGGKETRENEEEEVGEGEMMGVSSDGESGSEGGVAVSEDPKGKKAMG
jgi:hypothetical protein